MAILNKAFIEKCVSLGKLLQELIPEAKSVQAQVVQAKNDYDSVKAAIIKEQEKLAALKKEQSDRRASFEAGLQQTNQAAHQRLKESEMKKRELDDLLSKAKADREQAAVFLAEAERARDSALAVLPLVVKEQADKGDEKKSKSKDETRSSFKGAKGG